MSHCSALGKIAFAMPLTCLSSGSRVTWDPTGAFQVVKGLVSWGLTWRSSTGGGRLKNIKVGVSDDYGI